ncbi:MAG: nucleotidyltransferase family protein [Arcobacteraceae bacterium]|jgi:dTDP-glucose pyrophosphorylase|nr:nucleotidyltransferase family protein [Arcobacteraceae bacterium]
MKLLSDIKLSNTSTIKEALSIIDKGSMQIAIVVDDDNKLIGTLTDGDIRRGLLKGLSLDSSIETIIFRTPTVANINETKEEILKKAIAKKLLQIPIVDTENRVIGIKRIEELVKASIKQNKVVLMVGGLGTRLRPLTEDMPKPMLKVGNKPILQTIIEKFAEYGFINFILCVNYKSDIIKEYFGDGSSFGVNIEYIFEKERMGTAGALSLLQECPNEPFFVMNGDLLTNVNFELLRDYHSYAKSDATMCVREYTFQVPYGVVNIKNDDILSIEEKPSYKSFISAGIYMLSPNILEQIPKNEYFDMPTLFELLIKNNKTVKSFPVYDYWIDIGRIDDYDKANLDYSRLINV